MPDLIALRGDPSDKLPGARGIGPKKAAELLAQYGSLEAALADGTLRGRGGGLEALPANRDDGRLRPPSSPRRNIPGVGGGVFLPRTARARRGRRSEWQRYRRPDASRVRAAAPDRRASGAARAARGAARAPAHLERGPRRDGRGAAALPHRRARRAHPRRRGCRLARRRHHLHRDDVRGRGARGGDRDRGGAARRVRARPSARATTPSRDARWASACSTTSRWRRARRSSASVSSESRSSTSTSTTATAPTRSSATTTASSSSRSTSGRSIRAAAARTTRRRRRVNVPLRAGSGDEEYLEAFDADRRARGRAVRAGARARLGRLRRARGGPARGHATSPKTASASSRAACRALSDRVAAVLEGGYDLETLPGLVDAALDGFTS